MSDTTKIKLVPPPQSPRPIGGSGKQWNCFHRTQAKPIYPGPGFKLRGNKAYMLSLENDLEEKIQILIWTRKPIVAQRMICSKQRSIREIYRLHNSFVDEILGI